MSVILKNYKKNGLSSWWEVVAIYNAGENPADYKGFKDLYLSLEGTAEIKMASYVIVANIAIICGANPGDFEKYEEYKSILKNLLDNPSDQYTLNTYIFGYYALKCSGMRFDAIPLLGYFREVQKADGGYALSGDSGDVDMTAFVIQAVQLLLMPENIGDRQKAGGDAFLTVSWDFLENSVNENGTFGSNGDGNANSTACALSAYVGFNKDNWELCKTAKKAADGLELFKVKDKKQTGYSYLLGGVVNELATAQAAIALGDLKNKMSVWEKLYIDSRNLIK